MWFLFGFILSVTGFLLLFLPLEVPLHIPPALAATGWVFTRLLHEKTPTDRRFRRLAGLFALLSVLLVLLVYLGLWTFLLFVLPAHG